LGFVGGGWSTTSIKERSLIFPRAVLVERALGKSERNRVISELELKK
jgi:hypothetical protein